MADHQDTSGRRVTVGDVEAYRRRWQAQARSYGKAQAKRQGSQGAASPVRKVAITQELRDRYER